MADPRLLAFLADLGASDAQLEGLDDYSLIGVAGDLQLAAGLDLTLEELAQATSCSLEEVRLIYERLGLRADELAGFGAGDVAIVSLINGDASGIFDEIGPQILRVMGTSLARLAEAAVAAYIQDVETPVDDQVDLRELAGANAFAATLAMAVGDSLPTVFKHHMWAAVRRQRTAQAGVTEREVLRLSVGFVDLVGFTSHARSVTPAELIATIEDFERHAFEIATRHGGRIVKSIGDEVMIAGPEARVVAAIALELVEITGDDPAIAPRGGVSAGDVLFRLGDYYGPVVNLASRLATEAVPGEVLTDQAALAGPGLNVEAAGRRVLKGFAEPIAVWVVAPAV
jgi:adenylate cyclase